MRPTLKPAILVTGLATMFAIALVAQSDWRADTEKFRRAREIEIGGPGGWASLVGLHWLEPGAHTIGRGHDNAIVLAAPSAPDRLGVVSVSDDGATLTLASGVPAFVRGRPVTSLQFRPGMADDDALVAGKLKIIMIKRGARLALRVWDEAAPTRAAFKGLKWMPIDPSWRIDATFVTHTPAPKIRIANVLGETIEMTSPGYISFTRGGQEYRLEALLESPDARQLFFMFRDGTTRKTTYGAGRYLYTDLPTHGRVIVDFNRAMNPPCAFTNFATCPLPPASNQLSIAVTAGELDSGHTHAGQ